MSVLEEIEKADSVRDPSPAPENPLSFDDDPSLNPQNWSQARKILILAVAFNLVICATNGTSLASGGIRSTIASFGVEDCNGFRVLAVSIYLVGYAIGNTVLAPLSEHYGRRPVTLVTAFFFAVWMLACALAPSWAAFNVFRLLNGFFAAGSPSTASGICADLYGDDLRRGDALLWYNIATQIGSVLGPIISGWVALLNWRLSFWIGLAYGGVFFLAALWLIPETNHLVILDWRAKEIRKENCTSIPRGPSEDKEIALGEMVTKVLIRPLVMLCREPLVFFSCLYIAFQYGVFYIFLQSYPLIFTGVYGFNTGEEAQYIFETYYERASLQDRAWTRHHGAKRLPLACIAGPFIVLSLFWSAWTSRATVHWVVPALSGIPYGLGYILTISSLLNYLVDNYASFASSANAASGLTRQFVGAGLPFAAVPMYTRLSIPWASSLLGLVAALMGLIPFVFWAYGDKILARSEWALELAKAEEVDEAEKR
ncbi:hypothetical protein LZ554_001774 [Drepanopeziza brunnea f. sp. 'monogermtubi']|nr:hypothetical protein LZ554_001774 [Drepanopeziza brunnea f. sp. 'monogermtubi']